MNSRFHVYRSRLTCHLLVGCTVCALRLSHAQEGSVAYSPFSSHGVGIRANGEVVKGTGAQKPPWRADEMKTIAPEYPYAERATHHQGIGIFHLTVNPKTGFVTEVIVKKSTGYKTLDQSAVTAFRQWRWKPGRWKAFDFPVKFELTHAPLQRLPSGATRLPPSR